VPQTHHHICFQPRPVFNSVFLSVLSVPSVFTVFAFLRALRVSAVNSSQKGHRPEGLPPGLCSLVRRISRVLCHVRFPSRLLLTGARRERPSHRRQPFLWGCSYQQPQAAYPRASSGPDSSARCLALHAVGFAMPPLSPVARWALTPPFHPYPRRASTTQAVSSLWHCPASGVPPTCVNGVRTGGRYPPPCPAVLGLSSAARLAANHRDCPAAPSNGRNARAQGPDLVVHSPSIEARPIPDCHSRLRALCATSHHTPRTAAVLVCSHPAECQPCHTPDTRADQAIAVRWCEVRGSPCL
jgi:hypothetical protein